MVRQVNSGRSALSETGVEADFKRRIDKIQELRMKGNLGRQKSIQEAYAIHRKTVRGKDKDVWKVFLRHRRLTLPVRGKAIRRGSNFLPLLRMTMPSLPEAAYSRVAAALDYASRMKMDTATFGKEMANGGYIRLAELETIERTKERLADLQAKRKSRSGSPMPKLEFRKRLAKMRKKLGPKIARIKV